MPSSVTPATGPPRGILARVDGLDAWLHVTLVLLTVASAVRYVQGHGLGDAASVVLGGAAAVLAVYAVRRRVPWRGRRWWPPVWFAGVAGTWIALVLLAPSFAWCAVPLAFVALRVLPFGAACAVVSAMVVIVAVAWSGMRQMIDPTVLVGPACVAVLAVVAYQALDRDARLRQRLLDELREAQSELADTQHHSGRLAERARLSREIHDSVAQGLSSINLLLQAAEQDWDRRPDIARELVGQAARSARDGLDETRRLVRDLATDPQEVVGVPAALAEIARQTMQPGGLDVEVRVHGEQVPLTAETATALLRTARGALANVVEHADAARATMTLTFQETSVQPGRPRRRSRLRPGVAPHQRRRRTRSRPPRTAVADARSGRAAGGGVGPGGGHGGGSLGTAAVHRVAVIALVLVDDHPVVRAGLRALLESQPDLEVVGEAADAEGAVRTVRETAPAVVLMDLNLGAGPGGAEVTARLRTLAEPPQVLVLTTYDTEADILAAVDAGAIGYLLKDAPPAELFRAVRATARGEVVLAPTVAARLVSRVGSTDSAITEREIEVLELLAEGLANAELARRLLVSEATVKSHLSHIYAKLGVDTRAGAVAKAIERRVIRT